MLQDNTKPNWTAWITASSAAVVALVGGLWWLNTANGATKPPVVVATSCSGFQADARRLFDNGDTVALSGAFAPGDRVQLEIDFNGGYSWELTGVLADANKADVTGSGTSSTLVRSFSISLSNASYTSAVARGDVNGSYRLEAEVDVKTAGEGAITIKKTRSKPSSAPPKFASASCGPPQEPHPSERG
jgi:hypothetical protein